MKVRDCPWFQEKLEKAKGMRVYGVPIEQMDREELLACLVIVQEIQDRNRETHRKDMDTLSMLRRARG